MIYKNKEILAIGGIWTRDLLQSATSCHIHKGL